MNSTEKTARIAGLRYLVNGVTGFLGIIYVPSRLIVSGNAAASANNILASERLFRLGIASELICTRNLSFWCGFCTDIRRSEQNAFSAIGDSGSGVRADNDL
jgi:hypothetical protein